MKATHKVALALFRNFVQPVLEKQMKDTCFRVEMVNDHGTIDVRMRPCSADGASQASR